jgi:2-keto-3-deoxy-L-rhamnonate aldolase RhmA
MIRNKILERIRAGEKALGLLMIDPSELLVELAGRMGLDFVMFDGQHWPLAPQRLGALCAIADGFDVTPIMRVADQCETTILSSLGSTSTGTRDRGSCRRRR